jgi:hypothetical protein
MNDRSSGVIKAVRKKMGRNGKEKRSKGEKNGCDDVISPAK